jgi:hypothetical protein
MPVMVAGIAAKLTAHKEKEREHVEALLGSQKHLTSNVRTLINSKHKGAAAFASVAQLALLACDTH